MAAAGGPDPQTHRRREGAGAGPAGEEGGGRGVWPLRGRPGEDAGGRAGPGASPPRGQAARPRAPCCGRPAWLAGSGDRGRIVPGLGAGGSQHPGQAPRGPPQSKPPLADALAAAPPPRTPALGPSGHQAPGRPCSPSQPQFPHQYPGWGLGSGHSGLP